MYICGFRGLGARDFANVEAFKVLGVWGLIRVEVVRFSGFSALSRLRG